jgi:protein-L-isoaspartate(D-aspartate) O-methyltransferase
MAGVFRAYTMIKELPLLALITVASDAMAQDAQCVGERAAMVDIIRAYARSDASLLGPQGISERVLEAMERTERHRFIRGRSCALAYMDHPVPIGQGQTISQPYIVALMTHLAAVKFDDTVLEVGTAQVTRPRYWRVWCERSAPLRLFQHSPKPLRRC